MQIAMQGDLGEGVREKNDPDKCLKHIVIHFKTLIEKEGSKR